MKPTGLAYSRHTPVRCGAAGVISLLGGFGGPIPILDALILAGKSTKTITNWFPSKADPVSEYLDYPAIQPL